MLKRYLKHPFPYLAAVLLAILYFSLPSITQSIAARPTFADYAYLDASKICHSIQQKMLFPFDKLLSKTQRAWLVFPYYLLLFLLLRSVFIHTKKLWYFAGVALMFFLLLIYIFPGILLSFENDTESKSIGHVANGRIENSKRMYFRGANFTTYSFGGYLVGRTYVNDRIRKIIRQSYAVCEKTCPDITFVLGEIGRKNGGKFLPHRTHQSGLSVDFMTPLLKKEKTYRSNHLFNLWGYRHEFDNKGKMGKVKIDFETMAKHLYELQKATAAEGLVIQKVIFDPVLRPLLLATSYGPKIKDLPFTKKRVIVRHDDHYHIDFGVPSRGK